MRTSRSLEVAVEKWNWIAAGNPRGSPAAAIATAQLVN
jgi:hypothetical protein